MPLPSITHIRFLSVIRNILVLGAAACAISYGNEPSSSDNASDLPTEGNLLMINGDKLPALVAGKDKNAFTLKVSSPFLENMATFDLSQINAFLLPGKDPHITSNIELHLNNKDYLRGTLLSIDERSIKIKTSWSNELNVKRSLIESFAIHPLSHILFDGSQDSLKWENSVASQSKEKLSWEIYHNNFYSNKYGGICSPVLTEKKVRLSFYFLPSDYSMVPFVLWKKSPKDSSEEYSYTVTFRPNAVNAKKTIKNKTIYEKTFRINEQLGYNQKHALRFDLFIDRDEDKIYIYVDSFLKSEISNIDGPIEPPPPLATETKNEDKFGNYLYFSNLNINLSPILLTQLTVKKWNGTFPGNELLDVPVKVKEMSLGKSTPLWDQANDDSASSIKPSTNKETPQLQLVNGDIVNSLIPAGNPDKLTVKTPLYTTNLPLDKIMGGRFAQTKDRQRFSKDDIRVYLIDNSIVTLRFLHADQNNIYGFSESIGNTIITLSRIKRIDFNLYNDSLKKSRAKESPILHYFPQ